MSESPAAKLIEIERLVRRFLTPAVVTSTHMLANKVLDICLRVREEED